LSASAGYEVENFAFTFVNLLDGRIRIIKVFGTFVSALAAAPDWDAVYAAPIVIATFGCMPAKAGNIVLTHHVIIFVTAIEGNFWMGDKDEVEAILFNNATIPR
jgi:hypothetical protein